MKHYAYIFMIIFSLLFVTGCSDGKDGTDGTNGISITWLGSADVAPSDPTLNDAYYNTTDGIAYIWNGTGWDILAQDGTNGSDGISINWLGSFTSAPSSPQLNDAYYNTTDGISYIWDGTQWTTLAQDGTDGSDGISINWLGDLATAPSSPLLNDAYYNTTDGIAYIWDGSQWDTLTQDGTDGISINWLGSLSSAPSSPQLNDAYYNTTDGISYIWDGSQWTTLAQDGADGISVNWLGELATAPSSPTLNDAYYNTTDGIAYIWDGTQWNILAQDGSDGISINWLGSFASAPSSPQLNDAYYNTTDGISYIWDGSQWNTLAQDGTDGSDGISINWLGDLATAPSSPSLNDAYFNTTDGNAYIWDGSSWNTLVNGMDVTAPDISALKVSAGFGNAVITWSTNKAATSILEYGATAYDANITSNDFLYEHSVTITGLTAQDYMFKITVKDSAGNESNTTDTFTMQPSVRLGGTGNDIGHAIIHSKDGGFLIAGTTNSIDGDSVGDGTLPHGGDDYWVLKTDEQGTPLWSKRFGGLGLDSAYDLVELVDGTIAVVGETNSTNSGDVTNYKGDTDGWALLLSAEGSLIWQRDIGSSGPDRLLRITNHPEGGLFVGGTAGGTDKDLSVYPTHSGSVDGWLFKIDATGSIIRDFVQDIPYFYTYGTNGDDLLAATKASWDGYYLCGRNSGVEDGDINIPTIGGTGLTDIWLTAFDNDQNMLWVKTFGGDGSDAGVDVLKSPNYTPDPIYILTGTVTDTGRDIVNYHGGTDLWIGAIDQNGDNNQTWLSSSYGIGHTIGGSNDDYPVRTLWLSDDNTLVVGHSDSNDGDLATPGNQGGSDGWVIKIDNSDGNIIWNRTFGGSDAESINAAVELDDGSIVMVGTTRSAASLDLPTAKGGDDLWIIMVDSNGSRVPANP